MKQTNRVIAVLKKARRILAEKGWTWGVLARDRCGVPADWKSDAAVQFCMLGSVYRAAGTSCSPIVSGALYALQQQCHTNRLGPAYNDKPGRRKSTILRAFDKTIATLEKAKVKA